MTADQTSHCTWPALAEPNASALREAVETIFAELEPVGIIASGTIIRGTAHRNSDLDLCVVRLGTHRRRIQRFFGGVPAEIFVNPPSAVRTYFAEERRDGRRLTAHMFATGVVIYRIDPIVDVLRDEAAQWLAKKSEMSEFERVSTRYSIASLVEDGLDVIGTDDTTALLLLGHAVLAMLEYLCKAEDGVIPRRKDLLGRLSATHPDIAELATAFLHNGEAGECARLAIEIADRTIGARGFFEWDSGEGPAPV